MTDQSEKARFPRSVAMDVARTICRAFVPVTERLIVAGSLRRECPTVGDLEIVYIPKTEQRKDPADMFSNVDFNLADAVICQFEVDGFLERRRSVLGSEMFGPKNKLMRHRQSGLPVDLFSTTEECWWNYLVCRTGPKELNQRIAEAARKIGWKWNPYSTGFSNNLAEFRRMDSERAVFEFVNLPYQEPKDRQ